MVVRTLVLAAALVALAAPRVQADPKPWAAGVAPEAQSAALALYREGNAYFQQAQYKEALVKYELALAAWDHPAIRYNAAVCLINLDRLAPAWDSLESALRFGEAPLGADLYKEAQRYQKQLASQLGTLEVTCDVPGADVQLDGEPLLVAPGKATRRLVAGAHRLITTKEPDFVTDTRIVDVAGGKAQTVTIGLARREVKTVAVRATRLERRWSVAMPYLVMGAGAVIGGGGGALFSVLATNRYAAYDETIERLCPCDEETQMTNKAVVKAIRTRESADKFRIGAYVGFAVGGAAIATGIVLVLLNQPREIAITPMVEQPGVAITGVF